MENKEIKIKIDGAEYLANEGDTILQIARKNGVKIPSLCYHSDLEPKASCRLCLVAIEGRKGFFTSCSTLAEDGMNISTDSPEIRELRKKNLELLFAQHIERCNSCVRGVNCRFLKLAKEYGVDLKKYDDRKIKYPNFQFGPSIFFNSSKCIDCRNCVEMCEKQAVNFFDLQSHNSFIETTPTKDPKRDCVYCGQCIIHCPSGALSEVDSVPDVEHALADKDKYVVFQIAPSIRTTLGEEFGMEYGVNVTKQTFAALRRVGAAKVFDVSVAADVTTVEEANELIERVTSKKGLPMFTSCCPAWVKFVEFYYPEFIPNLTTVRSPQTILGGLTKTYFAEKEKVDPKKIVVVSIMPCTAKKYEITRKEFDVNGLKPIDYVLTTRELARLLKSHDIDLKEMPMEEGDIPWDSPTGAGIIYGATGGVTESALRTAVHKLCGQKLEKIDFKQVRGMEETREATIEINDIRLKIGIANGLGNAKKILEEIKKDPSKYDYVEIMACYGGCIGGGGQPLPTNKEIRQKRAQGLYNIDETKEVRLADESGTVEKLYKEFFTDKNIIHKICHTHYSQKKKENKF
ncbi:MAG: [FeFe] hydrogenase, group A [Candidatus Pacebacteria bacterium]|nr:[FeFe] hydrogenase, group A [Candidatus Paceibacterota bacterium]